MRNRIAEIIEERKMNVAAFARGIDVSESTLYSIINNRQRFNKIGVETFIKIAHGLGMTAEELWDQNYKEDKNLSEIKHTYRTVNDEGKRFLFASAMTAKSMYQVADSGGSANNTVSNVA